MTILQKICAGFLVKSRVLSQILEISATFPCREAYETKLGHVVHETKVNNLGSKTGLLKKRLAQILNSPQGHRDLF
jgi:hypothetical protein